MTTLEWKRNALVVIETLKARVQSLEAAQTQVQASDEPIAIVGLACRFPGAPDADAFWDLLVHGREAISEVPPDRWSIDDWFDPDPDAPGRMYTRYGAFLDHVDRFDAALFGIAPREALSMDPQQRLLLETAWHALESAAQPPLSLKHSRTGVFVGVGANEYAQLLSASGLDAIDAYFGVGNALNAIAGRVAFGFGLQGPAMAIDTACSSSLVAVHQACASLRSGESDLALAGGVNLILAPTTTIATCRARMLAPDGRCKTFDAAADGYVRGEGCGLIVLKRLHDAQRHGDRILALIRGSAVNQDGASGGLTVPNGPAQSRVVRDALAQAGLAGRDVDYLEAHGTGTSLGDPIEVQAAADALGANRSAPLLLGSVKTNIGHLEAASGIAGLIKVVLAILHHTLPRHLHCHQPNPHIPWSALPVQVVQHNLPWGLDQPPVAGVSSFGFSGTNAHVLLQGPPPTPARQPSTPPQLDRAEHLLVLSARTDAALRQLAGRYADWLSQHPHASLADFCFTAATGRSHLDERAALVTHSLADAHSLLTQLHLGLPTDRLLRGRAQTNPSQCAWLFGGDEHPDEQGIQALYATQPVFRAALDRSHAAPLASLPPPPAVQVALAEMWLAWGIEPDLVLGEGAGEYAAAAVAGAISTEEALRLFAAGEPLDSTPLQPTHRPFVRDNDESKSALTQRDSGMLLEIGPCHDLAVRLAELYCHGFTPDFAAWDSPWQRTRLDLPRYPFQGERYWAELSARPIDGSADVVTLDGARHLSATTGETTYESVVDTRTHPYLQDHAIHDVAVMPATGFAAMVLATRELPCRLSDVVFSEPLTLAQNQQRRMQFAVQPDGTFEFHTRSTDSVESDWRLHCRGRVEPAPSDPLPAPFEDSLDELRARLRPCEREEYFGRSAEVGLVLGPAFRGIQNIWLGDGEALADIEAPTGLGSSPRLPIHPAVLDACSQVAGALISENAPGGLFLPFKYRRLDFYRPAPYLFSCYGRLADSVSDDTRHAELLLVDSTGAVFGRLDGFVLKRARREALTGPGVLYGIAWQEQPPPVVADASGSGAWLLVGDTSVCEPLGAALVADGQTWLSHAEDAEALQGIVVDATPAGTTAGLQRALDVVQDALRRSVSPPRGLWFITRGTWSVAGGAATAPEGGLVWGLGRSLAVERPELACRLLDLDPATDLPFARLAETLTRGDSLPQQAWRGEARLVPRLTRIESTPGEQPVDVHSDATYLVTGGLGALGHKVAVWLAERGATHVVVTSRGAQPAAATDLFAELANHNCVGYAIAADVSNADDVAHLRASLDDLPPVRGVIHAAGTLDDGVVTAQTWDRFQRVLQPKMAGAWNLHRAFLDQPLDFFVMFSSVSAALGSAGQTNYAAANGFLDAFAEYRRGLGLHALSIHWGPWADGGMASDRGLLSRFRRQGIDPLSPSRALSALSSVMGSPRSEVTVLEANWVRHAEAIGSAVSSPLVEDLAPRRVAVDGSPWLDELLDLPPDRRSSWLEREVAALVQQVLSLPAPPAAQEGFFNLGMDSLSAVELGNLLRALLGNSVDLASTAVFDYPTVTQLAAHLATRLLGHAAAPRRAHRAASASTEPIAIVGVGCRFPGGSNPEEFWELLHDGVDAIQEVPPERWNVDAFYDPDPDVPGKMATRFGGFLRDIDQFEPGFFSISPREAESLDPQHRLLLEVSWEALEDAGIPPQSLMSTPAGVFIGMSTSDYTQLLSTRGVQSIDQYFGAGNSHSTAAGRISYVLGLEGPCFVVDTACSASLVALHQACRALQQGECDLALTGGVNATLIPDNTIYFSKARMMSPDGRCKTFDAAADGYVRGEGCGVVVLKRYSDARRDGDRIWGLVRGSAVNQDGRSGGLTVPNGPAQERVIREALAEGGIEPEQVSYVEAHGTGTALGDPIELTALQGVFGLGRDPRTPLLVGSVKTNVGHLEAAAGMAGLIKVLLAMRHDRIPPHLHFHDPTPRVPWDRFALRVVTEATEWPLQRRIAGLSSFAFSGTNAHVVLEAPSADEAGTPPSAPPRSSHLLVLSARSRAALADMATRYADCLDRSPEADFADVCFSAATGRTHFEWRAALVADSAAQARGLLANLAGDKSDGALCLQRVQRERPRCTWLFPGQGSQYAAMARELYLTQPVFRAVLDRCPEILPILLGDADDRIHDTRYAQPALFVVEMGLAALWQDWGITPDVVIGHSIGQYAAACVAGVFSLEDGVRLLLRRGELMAELPQSGAMAAIFADTTEVTPALARWPDVSLAADNGRHIVVSGPSADVQSLMDLFRQKGVRVQKLATSHAFHSSLIDGALDEFESFAREIEFHPPRIPIVCNLTGEPIDTHTVLDAAYWRRHARRPVQFARAMASLEEMGCGVYLEVGPGTTLTSIVAEYTERSEAEFIPSLRRTESDSRQLAHALGRLYVAGFDVNFKRWDAAWSRRRVSLPSYPFQRQRCWADGLSALPVSPPVSRSDQHLASGLQVCSAELSPATQRWLGDHRVFGEIVAPAALYVSTVASAAGVPCRLRDGSFTRAMRFPSDTASLETQLLVQPADASGRRGFEFFSRDVDDGAWVSHATGTLEASAQSVSHVPETPASLRARLVSHPLDELFARSAALGVEFGPSFRGLAAIWLADGEALGEIDSPDTVDITPLAVHPLALDAALQLVGAAAGARARHAYVPFEFHRCEIYRPLPTRFWCHAQVRDAGLSPETVTADLWLMDAGGELLGEIAGFVARRASARTMLGQGSNPVEDCLYRIEWRPRPRDDVVVGADYLPNPTALKTRVEPLARALASRTPAEQKQLPREMEQLSRWYILQAFSELQWTPVAGETFTTDELLERLAIVPAYRRLVQRLLQVLADGGWLSVERSGWRMARDWRSARAPRAVDASSISVERALLDRCGRELASVLTGATDPLELLFPRDGAGAEDVYSQAPLMQLFNELVQKTLQMALLDLPDDRPLRVLEIGAGTGGTTAALFPVLPAQRTEYAYTDISAGFFAEAEQRFAAHPFVQYRVLDIERDPAAQGFADHHFDVVVAANVLHATRDLQQTLEHVGRLLAPSGLLLLMEVVERQAWLDLTFGLLSGWWRFDDAVRDDHALLSIDMWAPLLRNRGFTDPAAIALDDLAGQAVLVARAPVEEVQRVQRPGCWLVFDDASGLAEGLSRRNQVAVTVDPTANQPAAWEHVLESALTTGVPLAGVVYCRSDCAELLSVTRWLVGRGAAPTSGLWIVTRGAQVLADQTSAHLEQSPLWGLGKVIALEHPDLRCRRLDRDPDAPDSGQVDLVVEEMLNPEAEDELAYRDGHRMVPRLTRPGERRLRLTIPQGDYQLEPDHDATLDGLHFVQRRVPAPGSGEVQVTVEAAGLNFRDVLEAMHALPVQIGPLGGELSGTVTAVGEGVDEFRIGDEVFGFGSGTFANRGNVPAILLTLKPTWLSHTDAAAVPVAFATAELAFQTAGLRRGERVLLHAASGGVGLTAIQVARALGAEVFATASRSKQAYLRSLGIEHVYDSRATTFADQILMDTGGAGVDVAINSLTSADFVESTLRALARNGRFVELSKRAVWTDRQMRDARPDVSYRVLALDRVLQETPDTAGQLLRDAAARLSSGLLHPIPTTVFPLADARLGFDLMRRARHTGKIVLSNTTEGAVQFDPRRAVVITGGMGGLGLALARWTVDRGARHLVLSARHPPSVEAEETIAELRSRGATVRVSVGDVSVASDVERLFAQVDVPIEGVFHLAGTLRDGALVNQTAESFTEVLAPKVHGAAHLHQHTKHRDLRWFVLFSSTASVFGSSGQANHAAANAFLDALAHHRRASGLPAISINWGAWSDIGSAIHGNIGIRLAELGMDWIGPELGFAALDWILARGDVQPVVAPIHWDVLSRQLQGRVPPFLSELAKTTSAADVVVESFDIRSRLEETPAANQLGVLVEYVASEVQQVLRLSAPPDVATGFADLGMDSLMAVELRNRLNRALGLEPGLASTALFDYPSVGALANFITGLRGVDPALPPLVPVDTGDAAELSAAELSKLLDERLALILGPDDLDGVHSAALASKSAI